MTEEPGSLAEVMDIPKEMAEGEGGSGGQGAVVGGTAEENMLCGRSLRADLSTQYHQQQPHRFDALPQTSLHPEQPLPPPRSISPMNPSIPLDPTLIALANASASIPAMQEHNNDLAQGDQQFSGQFSDYGALGEMGGKRKKLPHERAGWKEMDSEPPRKRGRKKAEDQAILIHAEEKNGDSGDPDSKVNRSEQNRKAQQAFRRRREERMKDLENAAASLEPLQRRLANTEDRLKESTLNLEASRLECTALRMILKKIAMSYGHAILTPQGALALDLSAARRDRLDTEEDVEAAFEALGSQTREVAKQQQQQQQQHQQMKNPNGR